MKSINKQRVMIMATIILVGGSSTVPEIINALNDSTNTVIIDDLSALGTNDVECMKIISREYVPPIQSIEKDTSWQAMNKGVYSKKQRRVKF